MNEISGRELYTTAAELLRERKIHLPQWDKISTEERTSMEVLARRAVVDASSPREED